MIPVTKPFLPPQQEYQQLVAEIWERQHLTNNGPLVQRLEQELGTYLDIEEVLFVSNGTIALQMAIKALELTGEIITTPFSYVATTSSIVWENCSPVFVDIDARSFNIDPTLIEQAITEKTSGILATHVFGNPCDIDAIQHIADKYELKVIYDAAHCFGTKYKGESVFKFGDISTTSFHATKLFQTIEGGAVFANDADIRFKLSYLRNFGHNGPTAFHGLGINGKNSEFHAAMGVCNLKYISQILDRRKEQLEIYKQQLENIVSIQLAHIHPLAEWNHSYCPVKFTSEEVLLNVMEQLHKEEVFPRRYFYPSLETLNYVHSEQMSVSQNVAQSILCLPLYHDLKEMDIQRICSIVSNR